MKSQSNRKALLTELPVSTLRLQWILTGLLCFMAGSVRAQQVFYPVESWQAYTLMREQILTGDHAGDRQLNRFAHPLYSLGSDSGKVRELLSGGRKEKPLLRHFYQRPDAFFLSEEKGRYVVLINPVLHLSGGSDDSGTLYRNTRGLEIMGNIGGEGKGIGFYSVLTENQELYPYPYRYYTDSLNHVPNEFFYKKFKNGSAVDFFQARGYFTFDAVSDHIRFQFGHDKHKIGNGYRSLILSDFAPQFLFLKINTDVGRFHYQNLFTQFTDNGPVMSNILYGKKYAAVHRLSFDILPNLTAGLTEMVIFDRMDSTQSNQFDLNYLNPVIFYRAIESNLGSRDNSMLALDFQYTLRSRTVFYTQFLLDEFNLKFLKNEPYWWANKFAWQLGARSIDLFGIKGFDALLEYNRARPYTYSHMRPTQSWTHFNQPLAHPLGANFSEGIAELRYTGIRRLHLHAVFIMAAMGGDSSLNGRNYGSNPLRSYDDRATEYDSRLLMGRRRDLQLLDFTVSYMLRQQLFADARINFRRLGGEDNLYFSLGLRLNASLRRFDY